MSNINIRIGNNVRKIRIRQGISQAELADRSDLHNNYIGRIELGKCNISVETLEKLSKGLGVDIGELL